MKLFHIQVSGILPPLPLLTIILYFPAVGIRSNIFEKWSRFKVTMREEGAEEIYFELKMLQVCMTFASWILGLLSYSFLD